MPGWELIDKKELEEIKKIFKVSNGVLFAHGFDSRRNNIFRVRDLEKNFSRELKSKFSLMTTSGTMAQYVAMKALGVKAGDEVITQAFTFVATVEAIIALGAKPIIVDIDNSYNMDPNCLEKYISKKTKLIIPVHMLGNPCDMKKIIKISKKYRIPILEDVCESLGGKYDNKYLGTIGDCGVFSLDFGKVITTGEGGLITSKLAKTDIYCREYIDHGHKLKKNVVRGNDPRSMPGLNLRMSETQAAIGLAQLKKLKYIIKKNKSNKLRLKSQIVNFDKIKFRTINDIKGEISDTLIFNFNNKKLCNKFLHQYLEFYSTKNVPDALKWHFSGYWSNMFGKESKYYNNWNKNWKSSKNLLERSIAIPILVKDSKNKIDKHAEYINKLLKNL